MIEPFEYFKSDPYPITLKNFPRFIDGSFDCVAVGGLSLSDPGPQAGTREPREDHGVGY